MAITPNGDPAWLRTADTTTYGGNLNKTNYQGQGVVNARTDVDATEFVRLTEDLAAVVRTAPLAEITFTSDDTGANNPTVDVVNLMTGIRATSYAGGTPPAGFPTVARVSDGVVDITFSTTLTDAYSVAGTVHIIHAHGTVHGAVLAVAVPTISDPNTDTFNERVTFRMLDDSGAVTDAKVTVEVHTGQV
jgi:hypothetical protein